MKRISRSVGLSDSSSTAAARRAGADVVASLGMNEIRAGEAAIIITEAARNAVVYARGGQLLMSGSSAPGQIRLDILALDRGPGITDLSRALQDGFSTGGTPGTGLGAIRRMASAFDLFSSPKGTALFARVAESAGTISPAQSLEFAGFSAPIASETVCGDSIAWHGERDRVTFLVADGLGHGFGAAEAAEEAVRIFHQEQASAPGEILARMHDALKKTRGAAAAIAELRPYSGTLTYAGVGNIAGVVLSDTLGRNLISHNGTLGHATGRIQEFKIEWPRDATLIMHSDGLQTRWDISKYPGLLGKHPAVIAGVLLRDFRRERDDVSVLVVKPAAQM